MAGRWGQTTDFTARCFRTERAPQDAVFRGRIAARGPNLTVLTVVSGPLPRQTGFPGQSGTMTFAAGQLYCSSGVFYPTSLL